MQFVISAEAAEDCCGWLSGVIKTKQKIPPIVTFTEYT